MISNFTQSMLVSGSVIGDTDSFHYKSITKQPDFKLTESKTQ